MAIDPSNFEDLNPSRFISFSFPNPDYRHRSKTNFYGEFLRVAVLDSPTKIPEPSVAAMLVPKNREHDWVFCTENGHFQLLFSAQVSRLILIGNIPCVSNTPKIYRFSNKGFNQSRFHKSLNPLLLALSPKILFREALPSIPFVSYEDNVVCSVVIEKRRGSVVGNMLIEDVELNLDQKSDSSSEKIWAREFRRRLRFESMPNLIQTEITIIPDFTCNLDDFELGKTELKPELNSLVHPYLPPMVASLVLVAPFLEDCLRFGTRPRFLCVGVGGGALLTFLHNHFKFDILGVEIDEVVLRNAKSFFGLVEAEFLRVHVGDGIKVIKNVASQVMFLSLVPVELAHLCDQTIVASDSSSKLFWDDEKNSENKKIGFFLGDEIAALEMGPCPIKVEDTDSLIHVILIDVNSGDAKNGLSAPPVDFFQKPVLVAARLALHERGILAVNVLPPCSSFYHDLVHAFREVFPELYEIAVGNGENYVLIATALPINTNASENFISEKLKHDSVGGYINRIRKI